VQCEVALDYNGGFTGALAGLAAAAAARGSAWARACGSGNSSSG
jgi:hypothetical protein